MSDSHPQVQPPSRGLALACLALMVAGPAAALECDPWPQAGRARLVVRRTPTHGLVARLTGRIGLPPDTRTREVSATLLAGAAGIGVARGDQSGLSIKRRGRGKLARIRARFPLGGGIDAADRLPATAVVAANGWCVTALFEQDTCRGRRSRLRCHATKTLAPPDVPALASLTGTYDGTETSAGSEGPVVAAVLDAAPGTASLVLRRGVYEGTVLRLALRPDGQLAIGGLCIPSDIILPGAGLLTVTAGPTGIRLMGRLSCGGDETDLVLARPSTPLPSTYTGAYDLVLDDTFATGAVSNLSLTVTIDERGAAMSAPSAHRGVDGMTIGDVEAGSGIVGPRGLLSLSATYRPVGDDRTVALVLFGRLVPSEAEPAGGCFYIGLQPTIYGSGAWTTNHGRVTRLDAAGGPSNSQRLVQRR